MNSDGSNQIQLTTTPGNAMNFGSRSPCFAPHEIESKTTPTMFPLPAISNPPLATSTYQAPGPGPQNIKGTIITPFVSITGTINGKNYLFEVEYSLGPSDVKAKQVLLIQDIQDPDHSVHLEATNGALGNLTGLMLYGNILFIEASNCIWILDISNPLQPNQISIFSPVNVTDMVISENYAYIASGKISVADISNLADPKIVENTEIPGTTLLVSGSLLFTLEPTDLYIADISSPTSIKQIGDFHNPGKPAYQTTQGHSMMLNTFFNDMSVSGHYVYIDSGVYGQRTIDVSDPSNPKEISTDNSQ
jgi:hypothetical protein